MYFIYLSILTTFLFLIYFSLSLITNYSCFYSCFFVYFIYFLSSTCNIFFVFCFYSCFHMPFLSLLSFSHIIFKNVFICFLYSKRGHRKIIQIDGFAIPPDIPHNLSPSGFLRSLIPLKFFNWRLLVLSLYQIHESCLHPGQRGSHLLLLHLSQALRWQ